MTAFHYLKLIPEIMPDIMMSASELSDIHYTDGKTHYAAGTQLVNADRPVLLHAIATEPHPANDNKKLPLPAVPAALNKFMHNLARMGTTAKERQLALDWLSRRWSPQALFEGLRIFQLIRNTNPKLLRRLDPHHTIELALHSRASRSFLAGLKNWQSQIAPAPLASQPTVAKSGRNLKQWQKQLQLMYMWRGFNHSAA